VRQAEIERDKRQRPDNLGAYDLLLRALPDVYAAMPAEAGKALHFLDRALALEPDYALAHGYASWCHEILFVRGGQNPQERDAAIRHAQAAIVHGPDDADALALAAFALAQIAHDMPAASKAFEQALAVSPSCFLALTLGAAAFGWKAQAERAIEWGERALRVSPFDRLLYEAAHGIALGNFLLGRNDKSADAARLAIQVRPQYSTSHVLLAAALSRGGRIEDAKVAAARALRLRPEFSTSGLCAALAIPPSLATPLSEALRAAGLPE
jgi:adenylate cyclase